MEDRRTNYYQNISLCANGCTYKGVNINDLRVSCSCEFNSGDNNNKEELSIGKKVFSSFKGSINQNNYIVITCYKIVFDLDIIKNNIGFYVFLIFNLMQIINLIIFSIYSKIIFAKAFCSNPSINQKHNNSMISNDTISYASSTINLSKQKPNNNKEHRSAYHKYLDDMDYENAKKKDSRKVYSVIIWRSKHYHPFYIAFCEENEENIKNVAIGLLLIGIKISRWVLCFILINIFLILRIKEELMISFFPFIKFYIQQRLELLSHMDVQFLQLPLITKF